MKKLLLICILFGTSVYSLEFGYMGNKAFGMGGSGVALTSNPFSAYYNPALIGTNSTIGIGYSLGLRYKEHNIGILSDPNIETAKSFLGDNSLNMTSENGIAIQLPLTYGDTFSSAIGIGVFYTKIGVINFIVNGNNGGGGGGGGGGNNSLSAKMLTNGLDLLEIPLSYSLSLSSMIGNFSVGVNAKYINAKHSLASQDFSVNNTIQDSFNQVFKSKNGISTNAFGVDVGLSYSLPFDTFVIGVVGKNLNTPNINTMANEKLALDPQYRLGISTSAIPLTTIALDLDLKPNTEFRGLDNKMAKKQVQYISLGGDVNLTFMDIKLGVAKNIVNGAEGWLIYAGLGFKIIDISLFSNTNITRGSGSKIPTEFGVKIGGGFSF